MIKCPRRQETLPNIFTKNAFGKNNIFTKKKSRNTILLLCISIHARYTIFLLCISIHVRDIYTKYIFGFHYQEKWSNGNFTWNGTVLVMLKIDSWYDDEDGMWNSLLSPVWWCWLWSWIIWYEVDDDDLMIPSCTSSHVPDTSRFSLPFEASAVPLITYTC